MLILNELETKISFAASLENVHSSTKVGKYIELTDKE